MTTSAAYLRILRDIDDGHITLSVSVDRYDPITGQPLLEPCICSVGSDRAVSGIVDSTGHWWEPLVAAGYLALTDMDRYGRTFYKVTAAGRRLLADHKAGPR